MSLRGNIPNRMAHIGAPSAAPVDGKVITHGLARWLCLAATPAFAIMAVLTAIQGGPQAMPDMPMPDTSLLGGVSLMYALMGLFHLPPWLELIGSRRGGGRTS